MSHPTDDELPPTATASPAEPPPAPVGVSNVFEVEEQTPDGGSTATAPAPAPARPAAPARPPTPAPKAKPEPEPPHPAASPDAEADADEDAPQLVWYVLKVQSGREDTICAALERRVKIHNLGRFFGRIVVPKEKITEIRNNKKRIVERKSYPGYIMAEMELNEKTWFLVRETPGVGDFVGAHGTPSKMSTEEVDKMLGPVDGAKPEEAPRVRIDVERGDRVKIKDGPFENFEGTVEEVIEQRGLVKVMLIIFNRPTPVDLEYWQVERI
jgi:transcriptional antiterminator NusG